jgi:hypothetical protein
MIANFGFQTGAEHRADARASMGPKGGPSSAQRAALSLAVQPWRSTPDARSVPAVDDMAIRRAECRCEVDEFTAIAEGWRYFSDGCGDLTPFCPECATREFAVDAPVTAASPRARSRDASSSDSSS